MESFHAFVLSKFSIEIIIFIQTGTKLKTFGWEIVDTALTGLSPFLNHFQIELIWKMLFFKLDSFQVFPFWQNVQYFINYMIRNLNQHCRQRQEFHQFEITAASCLWGFRFLKPFCQNKFSFSTLTCSFENLNLHRSRLCSLQVWTLSYKSAVVIQREWNCEQVLAIVWIKLPLRISFYGFFKVIQSSNSFIIH